MRPFFVLSLCLVLAGCATQGDVKPAVCDGKHRRPANPYGSVLPAAPSPAGAIPSVAGPAPRPQSAIDPRSFHPCGDRA